MAVESWSHLGNYDIGDVICLGDAGSCYRVHNVELDRNAAATILYTHNGAGTNLIQQKLENAIELSHPAIVTPTRIDTLSDGNLYVIYEHFADALLAQRSKDERFRKPNFALNFIRQIAEALEHAARQQVIHHNVSPDHIWLKTQPDGSFAPAIVDWGVPFLGDNQLKPTYVYAPPEIEAGKDDSTPAMIYSLGIIAYELLVGGHPSEFGWQASGTTGLRPMPVYLGELRADLAEETCEFVQTCVRTQTWARYSSFLEFYAALDAALAAEQQKGALAFLPGGRHSDSKRRSGVMLGGLALVALLALVLWLLFAWLPGRDSTATAQQSSPVATEVKTEPPTPTFGRISLSADAIPAEQPLSVAWQWQEPIDGAQFAVYLENARGSTLVETITDPIGDGQYSLDAPLLGIESGDYELIVRLEAVPSGEVLAESEAEAIRIMAAATVTVTATMPVTPTASLAPVVVLPTAVDTPTATATSTPMATPTEATTPESTPTPEPTEPRLPAVRVTAASANIRWGPSVAFSILGGLRRGTEVQVLATDEFGYWYLIELADGRTGWIAASVSEPAFEGALDSVGVADFIPVLPTNTPTSLPPTLPPIRTTPTPNPVSTPTPQPTPVPDTPTPTPIRPT